MGNLTPGGASTVAPLTVPEPNSPHKPGFGKPSYTPKIVPIANLLEIIKALAIIQDGLRKFVLTGGLQKPPTVNDKGILIIAIKLPGHTLGVGPDGNFTVDSRSVMEGRQE